ncbi:ABC transporter permease [Thermochromatium tepidum]|uniref:Transport permease protein n=1 Tax=Thermochromatium tepidum ATCC 43061 TaxID=316276 RepID=A0A6I6E0V6_THETI|nr:ABC transporter permease [Thermochromatium tepidum]QGU33551.1 ABC transporter permease [Thermochromatium tepidum ATCC 43061]
MTSSPIVRILGPLATCFVPLSTHRRLLIELTQREVLGRYRGSFMGIAWSLLHPLLMLSVYTFVFSYIFESRWGLADESRVDFAIILFVGMIVYGFFAECITRAPSVILHNPNYVKKVIFPLEILPWILVLAAGFHALVSVIALLLVQWLLKGTLPATALLLPILLLPFVLLIAGLALILASLGTFVRDIGQVIGVLTTILLFLSPVFYPVSRLPEPFQVWMTLNPLSFMIEEGRKVLVFGLLPDVMGWLLYSGMALFILWLGHWWFQFTRDGFADVL